MYIGVTAPDVSLRKGIDQIECTSAVTLQDQKFGMILGTEDAHQSHFAGRSSSPRSRTAMRFQIEAC